MGEPSGTSEVSHPRPRREPREHARLQHERLIAHTSRVVRPRLVDHLLHDGRHATAHTRRHAPGAPPGIEPNRTL